MYLVHTNALEKGMNNLVKLDSWEGNQSRRRRRTLNSIPLSTRHVPACQDKVHYFPSLIDRIKTEILYGTEKMAEFENYKWRILLFYCKVFPFIIYIYLFHDFRMTFYYCLTRKRESWVDFFEPYVMDVSAESLAVTINSVKSIKYQTISEMRMAGK